MTANTHTETGSGLGDTTPVPGSEVMVSAGATPSPGRAVVYEPPKAVFYRDLGERSAWAVAFLMLTAVSLVVAVVSGVLVTGGREDLYEFYDLAWDLLWLLVPAAVVV